MKPRRVLILSPVWKGALGFFCQRGFQQLGHEVHAFDYRQVAYGSSQYRKQRAGILRVLRNKAGIAWMNYQLRQEVARLAPDLILAIKGELIEESTVKHLVERSGAAVTLWYPDTSRGLTDRSERRIVGGMRWYDVSFVCDPDHIPDAIRPTIRRMAYLTFACDPEFHHPVSVSAQERERFGGPACFVGNWQGTESPRYALLRHLAGYPVKIWGLGWQESDLAAHGLHVMNEQAYGDDMLKVYSSTLIALNLNYDTYLNFRNFEVPASGPLLLTTAIPQLEGHFRPDEEIVTFESADELRAKVGYYLQHRELAAQVGRRGFERAHREHTFRHRMAELLGKIGRA